MNKLTGLKIKLDRPIDRERPCCLNVCTISARCRDGDKLLPALPDVEQDHE